MFEPSRLASSSATEPTTGHSQISDRHDRAASSAPPSPMRAPDRSNGPGGRPATNRPAPGAAASPVLRRESASERAERIARIREEIEAGTYEAELKIEKAIHSLIEDLGS